MNESLAALGSIIAFAGTLAMLNERLNELLVLPLIEKLGLRDYNAYAAVVVGTGLGVLFGVDFLTPLADLFGVTLNAPLAGLVVSGIVIGGGSNLLHDIVGGWGGGRASIQINQPTISDTSPNDQVLTKEKLRASMQEIMGKN